MIHMLHSAIKRNSASGSQSSNIKKTVISTYYSNDWTINRRLTDFEVFMNVLISLRWRLLGPYRRFHVDKQFNLCENEVLLTYKCLANLRRNQIILSIKFILQRRCIHDIQFSKDSALGNLWAHWTVKIL